MEDLCNWLDPVLGQLPFHVVAMERAGPDCDAGSGEPRAEPKWWITGLADVAPASVVFFDHAVSRRTRFPVSPGRFVICRDVLCCQLHFDHPQ